ncbi:TIGR01244 family sulfur transferase [Microvirga sp. M2]|uniref:TIGR01244 family sulfur transferase n=1 Tax=Microvirga sp. M2 TaxID=3073270 RepID=UPI0039C3900D
MQFAKLTDHLSVSPQLRPEDLKVAAAAGFRAIINNRPDGEAPDQPPSNALAAAARRLGLPYWHIPVVPGRLSPDRVEAFKEALTATAGPTLAFCRTGTRSASLWALASARHLVPDVILRTAADAGYDLEALRSQIDAASRHPPTDSEPERRR